MRKTIGIFAHVDAGKTTFSEQILFHTKSIRTRGRVDHKEAFLDSHKIEKERGITVFSDIGVFNYKDSIYYLIDTPGHIDFSPEMERTISVLDYAVLLVSAVEGVQGHTETVWSLLRKHNVPTFIFINKIDREGANLLALEKEIKITLSEDICFIDVENELRFNEKVVEFIAERDEYLFELYLEGGYDEEVWREKLKTLIKENKIFITTKGAALLDQGVKEFLNIFHDLTFSEYEEKGEFIARVLKIKHDDKGNRLTFLKALSGELKIKDEISYISNGEEVSEKINEIRQYNGTKYEVKNRISAGEVLAVIGLSNMKAGMAIGAEEISNYDMVPTLRAKVIFDNKINPQEVLKYFRILESEENTLNVIWDEYLQQIHISIMGIIHLEVLKEILKDRFNLEVEFGSPEILYKETIKGLADGYGHFEPLRHYAEVHLKLEEGQRGEGITFENKCHSDFLSIGNMNLVKTHIFEKEHKGILTGSPLTDIKVTLVTGRAHNKHTSGGDFREATKRALRQGLENVKNELLEPYYRFKIDVDMSLIGRVLSDIQKMSGEFSEPENYGGKVVVTGVGPVSTFMDYPLEFQSFTRGKGSISLVFYKYDICHNQEVVIKARGYNKDADPEYTSSSIFCSKGEGFVVKGEAVKEYMHCLK